MITINLEENDAKYLAAIMTSWRNDYEMASDRMAIMLQDLKDGLAPEERWDEPTILKHMKANDCAINSINKVLDQIGAPTVL